MARAQKLKVYRTVAGFHDAYVAAASQKAALAAWGSDKDLFARGIAEQVTDDALTAEPLAAPGTVIKRAGDGRGKSGSRGGDTAGTSHRTAGTDTVEVGSEAQTFTQAQAFTQAITQTQTRCTGRRG
ncbi:hypothetical protein [Sphingomonas sp. LR55]|uniref:hypothetical protein n=1 Tax=Sphingomonas sp. LR55 TaxID=3050231 RepID=UPI002FDFAB88